MDEPIDICLTRERLDTAAAVARVSSPDAGGIAVFLGTTRAEPGVNPGDGPLLALDYHGYEEMAVREIEKLARDARKRWPIKRIALWHRLGEVKIGEPSVVIAVSAPHRGEAFDACEFLIDELKKTVPLWKREVYERASHWQ